MRVKRGTEVTQYADRERRGVVDEMAAGVMNAGGTLLEGNAERFLSRNREDISPASVLVLYRIRQ